MTSPERTERRWAGLSLIVLAVLAMIVSMAMPGGGWLIGMATLLLSSVLVRAVGWRALAANLIIYGLHMFSLGPLSYSAASSVGLLVILLTSAPAIAAAMVIIRSRRQAARRA